MSSADEITGGETLNWTGKQTENNKLGFNFKKEKNRVRRQHKATLLVKGQPTVEKQISSMSKAVTQT